MAETKKAETKKPTEYVVLQSESPTGPFTPVGPLENGRAKTFSAFGQIAAKKAAATFLYGDHGSDPEQSFFTAVPASSWVPQKPVIQMSITFLTDAGEEQPDEDEDTPVEDEDVIVVDEILPTDAGDDADEFAATLDD